MDYNAYMSTLCEKVKETYTIDKKHYSNDHIKRGLRNADGSGVIAGITNIGSVQGYYIQDSAKVPIKGELYYRGIRVDDIISILSKHKDFGYEEVSYLLLFGSLPTKDQFTKFKNLLTEARELPKGFFEDMILKAPSSNVMNKLERSVLAMYSYDPTPDSLEISNVMRQCITLIGSFPTIVAHAYAVKRHVFNAGSLYIHNPKKSLSVAQDFLRMLRKHKHFSDEEAKILDIMLILHAEHGGGNNSTFACRTLTSSGTDTYSAIAAAVGSLKGPLHGGANAKVREMLNYIKSATKSTSDKAIKKVLEKILDKKGGDGSGKLYGLGHAIYTMSDPRTEAIRKYARKLIIKKGLEHELEIAEKVENIGIPMVMERTGRELPMCANVDLYSGLVYQALGIPEDLFTPLFAIARISGWCAHRLEEIISGGRIIRPAYRALAIKDLPYIPLRNRK